VSLVSEVSINDTLNIVALAINNWVKARGGQDVRVIPSQAKLWQDAMEAGDAPLVLLCYQGEKAIGPSDQENTAHRVLRNYLLVVMRGQNGFWNLMPDGTRATSGDPNNFYKDIECLRDQIRCICGISQYYPIEYGGIKPLPAIARPGTGNIFLDGLMMEFSTYNDIPAAKLSGESQTVFLQDWTT
jgi:hypothetical protein